MTRYIVRRTPSGWNVTDVQTVSKIGLPHTLVARHGSDRVAAEAHAARLNAENDCSYCAPDEACALHQVTV